MFAANADRVVTFLKVSFTGDVTIYPRIPAAAAALNDRFNFTLWNPAGVGAHALLLRDFEHKLMVIVQPDAIQFQMLGVKYYSENVSKFADGITAAVRSLGLTKLGRLGFQTNSWIDLEMTVPEITEAMMGVILASKEKLDAFPGPIDDTFVEIYGKKAPQRYRLRLLPQSPEHVKNGFFLIPNLEVMQRERWTEDTIASFFRVIHRDSLLVESDIYEESPAVDRIGSFLQESIALGDALGDIAISRILGTPNRD